MASKAPAKKAKDLAPRSGTVKGGARKAGGGQKEY